MHSTDTQLANGLRITVLPRGQVPLASVRLVIGGGAFLDPKGKAGLADFTTRLLRRGTQRRTADELNEAVEFVGGSLEAGADDDGLGMTLLCPTEVLGQMLGVMAELVASPAFPKREVEAERRRLLAQLANDLDDPGTLADRALLRVLFGSHPYGNEVSGTARDVATFTRDDVVRFHAAFMGPAIAHLYVVGPVDVKETQRLAKRAFAHWHAGPRQVAWVAPGPQERAGQLWLVDKPEQTQSQVRLGTLSYARGDARTFAGVLATTVLGAGFTSRLMTQIRVNRGLSYGVDAGFDTRKRAGIFTVGSSTKTESTAELIQVALGETRKLRANGFRKNELAGAKRYVTGLYPLRTERNESLARALSEMDLYGLGRDWVDRYVERINAVTEAQALAVAREYFFRRPPSVVVVGNAQRLRKQLAFLGRAEVLRPAEV
jgi:zinc protease